jgi:hypothetical protein
MTLTPALLLVVSLTSAAPPDDGRQTPPRSIGDRAMSDETINVPKGTRIELDNCMGDLTVRTWDRDAVRVQGSRAGRSALHAERRNQVLRIESSRGLPIVADVELTVPVWIGLQINGVSCTVDVDGVAGAVDVETVESDITLNNVSGSVKAGTVEGGISVTGSRGRLELNTIEGDIIVTKSGGEVTAESVDGNITFNDVDATALEAMTVDGDVRFSGRLMPNGRYLLTTHDGDVWLTVPDNANATLAIRLVADGGIDSSFSLPSTGTSRGRRRIHTLGNGSAQVEIEIFDGTLYLRRP